MRKRNKQCLVRFSPDEMKYVDQKVKESGLSKEGYFRKVLLGKEIKALPPLDYFELKRELSAVGNNLNQIARVANATKKIDTEYYKQNIQSLEKFFKKMIIQME
ncbi:MAG: MobC family plasmid mobilization relaxosome protein [Clostridiaceae bacterium]|nr:MobC family plasmid mobilization relaxosome protein [Clostridiaceae bacterium]